MKPKALILVILISIISLFACSKLPSPPFIPDPDDLGFNLLISAEGAVRLQRDGWPDYHPTNFGALLYRGDQLWPADGAEVSILCDSLTIQPIPAGMPTGLNNVCPRPSKSALVIGESVIGNTRGGSDPHIPYIISPRKTQLLNNRPLLRWNETTDASSYHVQIKNTDTGQTIWDETMDGSAVTYPGEPPLEPNVTYLLIVVADNGTSSPDEGVPDLSFSLLDEQNAQDKWAGAVKLTELNLSAEAEAFATAKLFAGHDLIAEAIEMLEMLAEGGSQKAAVYHTLGDLYRHIGLNLLAEDRYLVAIKLADVADDVEGLATAQAGLGEVYIALGDEDEAIKWLTEAKAGYDDLGDTERTSELENRLVELGQ